MPNLKRTDQLSVVEDDMQDYAVLYRKELQKRLKAEEEVREIRQIFKKVTRPNLTLSLIFMIVFKSQMR